MLFGCEKPFCLWAFGCGTCVSYSWCPERLGFPELGVLSSWRSIWSTSSCLFRPTDICIIQIFLSRCSALLFLGYMLKYCVWLLWGVFLSSTSVRLFHYYFCILSCGILVLPSSFFLWSCYFYLDADVFQLSPLEVGAHMLLVDSVSRWDLELPPLELLNLSWMNDHAAK